MKLKTIIFNSARRFFKIPYFEKGLRRLINNNPEVFFLQTIVPNNYQYNKGSMRNVTINNINLSLDISDYIGHFLYFGFPDPSLKELNVLSKGKKVILDVGANIGFTSLMMAEINGNNTVVHAFEPDSFNYSRLVSNLKLNTIKNVIPYELGFGDAEGEQKLVVANRNNLGENKVNMNATTNYSWVNISTIDIFCKNNNINNIDLIKIDVEGYEYNVLKGAKEIIKLAKPILFIEVIDKNLKIQNSSAKELIAFIEQYYSVIYDAATKEKITSNDDLEKKELDIVAIP